MGGSPRCGQVRFVFPQSAQVLQTAGAVRLPVTGNPVGSRKLFDGLTVTIGRVPAHHVSFTRLGDHRCSFMTFCGQPMNMTRRIST